MRHFLFAALLIAAASFVFVGNQASAHTSHKQSQQTVTYQPQEQDPGAAQNVAQAGEDIVNVIVNVGRTTGRAITCVLGDEAHC